MGLLPALLGALSCAGAEAEADPLARCAENLKACYAPCPRPTWVLMANAPGHLCATGQAEPGGRQHSRAVDSARQRLAASTERLGLALAQPLADGLSALLDDRAAITMREAVEAVVRSLAVEVTAASRVAQVYEDCVTGDVLVLVVMDPAALVESAVQTLERLGRETALFRVGRDAEALEAARKILEARIEPDEPRFKTRP